VRSRILLALLGTGAGLVALAGLMAENREALGIFLAAGLLAALGSALLALSERLPGPVPEPPSDPGGERTERRIQAAIRGSPLARQEVLQALQRLGPGDPRREAQALLDLAPEEFRAYLEEEIRRREAGG